LGKYASVSLQSEVTDFVIVAEVIAGKSTGLKG
jgi:hypothetical protein